MPAELGFNILGNKQGGEGLEWRKSWLVTSEGGGEELQRKDERAIET